MEQTQVRMEPRMKQRVQVFMERFEKKTNAKVGFSAAIRLLLERSLDREGIPK